jgi:radical SAM-linked protein
LAQLRDRDSKSGRAQFLGHLDLTRTVLRALRRARVPLVYSHGFNPKPRVQFGPALSVGIESHGEYIDFESSARLDVDVARLAITGALPRGFEVLALREIQRGVPGLSEAARAAHYLAILPVGLRAAAASEAFARREALTVTREKNGKRITFPLEQWLLDVLEVDASTVRMTLRLDGEGASVRADEVLALIYGDAHGIRLVREDLAIDFGGRLVSLLLAAPAAVSVVERTAV